MSEQPLPISTTKLRESFCAFSEQSLTDQVFMDNAAGSYTATEVLKRFDHFYTSHKVQPYGVYPASIAAGQMMDESYERIAAALNLPADWIQFGPSTSQNTYVLGKAFAEYLQPGDAIIVTDQDHEANTGAWRKISRHGIEVREWAIDPHTGHLDPADLENLLDDKVRLVAFPHVSNIVGEINPAKELCALIRRSGAISVVDGVSFAPHSLPDLADLGADIYLFSTYKTYGPHLGIMAIDPDLNRTLPNQGHFFNEKKLRYRLTPAGPDHAQIGAVGGIADYLERLAEIAGSSVPGITSFEKARNAMRAQEKQLMVPLLDFLSNRNDIRLIGPADPDGRAPTISLAHHKSGSELAKDLAPLGIMAAGGHFYAWRTLQSLGIDPEHGVLRLSFVHYTSRDDVARTISALDAILSA
ncbi:MAG: aminotransferase class V-fold PLP-dependent enzyme [Hyphomicrobiaceae bacterium]|nr:aminotransferase class V-fold PLP-dependent enzyme [Hyphomicrobiaceae bacterium]MCC0023240.1 aminotransferase class V-fold PLP-dependent enzyme [Hyphomicrobiaceae bacterium]